MAELQRPAIFKWRHFSPEVILCAVRWYLRYFPSYRDAQELLVERGLEIDHTDHRAIKKRIRPSSTFGSSVVRGGRFRVTKQCTRFGRAKFVG